MSSPGASSRSTTVPQVSRPRRLVVVGGGISGLAAARAAADRAEQMGARLEVLVLEKETEVGGKARSLRDDGWLLEAGPGSFLDDEEDFQRLVRVSGFDDERLAADAASSRRYLYQGGQLREVPMHPLRFATSGLLGPLGLLRILAEPLVPARRPQDVTGRRTPAPNMPRSSSPRVPPRAGATSQPPFLRRRRSLAAGKVDADGTTSAADGRDESIWEFAARRLGRQVADRLVAPMVLGIYAGDARRLSLPAAMPKLARLERQHGSLLLGMLAKRRAAPERGLSAGPSGKISSFQQGMQSLPLALASDPRIRVRRGAAVEAIRPVAGRPGTRGGTGSGRGRGSGDSAGFADGAGDRSNEERRGHGDAGYEVWVRGDREPIPANAVVLAGEAFAMAALLSELAPRTAQALAGIELPAVTVVGLGFGPEAIGRVPRGFGVLVPRGEGPRTLGCVWDSFAFPGRSPEGHLLVRAMLGGSVDPEAGALDEAAALQLARREVTELLGLTSEPAFERVVRWPRAIPQYDLDHSERLRTAREELAGKPGLYLAGNSLAGVSFARSGATGFRLGRQAAEHALA